MSLKYYKQENERYGDMGVITEAQALNIIRIACAKFDMPHVKFNINPRKRRMSHYKAGATMIAMCGRVARPLAVPLIDMAPTMMHWSTLLHEFAHHIHTVRFNAAAEKLAATLSVVLDTRQARQAFSKKHVKREHAHGHTHRVIMQELVNFFVDNGMITQKPTYMKSLWASGAGLTASATYIVNTVFTQAA